jgi:YHS domain-containing protein
MSKAYHVLSLLGFVAVAAGLAGCSKEQPSAPVVVEEEVVEEVAVPEVSPSDITDAMAGLSEADRAAAMAQKVCPVSGEMLGEMGTPIKVTVKGRDVFLCCEGCREKIEADPDKYLAKLDAKPDAK